MEKHVDLMGTLYELKCCMSIQGFIPLYSFTTTISPSIFAISEASVRSTVQTNNRLHSSLAETLYSYGGACVFSLTQLKFCIIL